MSARHRVLIVGGYGAFGARAAERLAREADLEVIVAGRSEARASAAAAALASSAVAAVTAAAVDATRPDIASLSRLAPTVIINASGPFQSQNRALARAAVTVGAHYIDLADARDYVVDFAGDTDLDSAARARGVLVVAGASTVPAVSAAVIDDLLAVVGAPTELHYGISPGNSFEPGPATTASVVGAIGLPFETLRDGRPVTVHGWQGISRHEFPAIGRRWLGYCDVPDLHVFRERYPTLRTIDFKAGVEVGMFHLGLWALSWPCRYGVLRRPERLAGPLLALKRRLGALGTDTGGMFLRLQGQDGNGRQRCATWHMEAFRGHGPYIPATPAVILARKLARGECRERGARACVGLVTLAEIERELADLDIRFTRS